MAERKSPRKLDGPALLEYALKTLSARAHSLGEMRQKLMRRADNPADIEPVLFKLKEYGALNDRKFAESFANNRLENRGHGRLRVLRDLRQRRVAPKLAEEAVQQTFSGQDEMALVDAYLERKYRSVSLPEYLADEKHMASAYRRLRHAGFSHGSVVKVLLRHAKQAELLETLATEEEPEAQPQEQPARED